MPKLRDDLLRNLSPDDQKLMKIFRKRPLKAYTLKELLPKSATAIDELILINRLNALMSQHLIMIFFDEGKILYSKATGRPSKKGFVS